MNPFEALELMNALKRNQTTHKGDCGKVLLVGGAAGMARALTLMANACLYSGTGLSILMILTQPVRT
jgi:NAD(P)H-hydrate repair Nnr-like enzyme with NAD(P)H-hydrate dehydratase domain